MQANEMRTRELLAVAEAVLPGHFVGTSGNHLDTYVAKDRATRRPSIVSELCKAIAIAYVTYDIDAVVSPAVGAIALSQWTAYHLSCLRQDRHEVLALYSEHDDTVVDEGKGGIIMHQPIVEPPASGEELILRRPRFVLKRGFDMDVRGKRVLAAEDILTTGGSAASTVEAIRSAGGIVVGVGALVNGGKVTKERLGVGMLVALLALERKIYTEEDCRDHGLCHQGVPINTQFGHGAAFLARQAAKTA
jgi:orotate phosphoribosyltransferase